MLAAHAVGMIQHITRQRLSAGPGKRPERRRQSLLVELLFRLLPKRSGLVGKIERDFADKRHRPNAGVGADEGLRVGDLGRHSAIHAFCLILRSNSRSKNGVASLAYAV